MVVHPGKTKSMVLASRQKHQLQPLMLNLTLCTHINEQVREHSVLGITIDEEIKWQPYIDNVCKQVARILCLLGRLRKYVDTDRRKLFFNAHLLAHINYASIALSNASEVHFKKKKSTHSTDEQQYLYYLITPCQRRQNFRNQTFFCFYTTQLCLCLKCTWAGLLSVNATFFTERLLNMSKKTTMPYRALALTYMSFAFSGSSVWNSLPPKMKTYKIVRGFKVPTYDPD